MEQMKSSMSFVQQRSISMCILKAYIIKYHYCHSNTIAFRHVEYPKRHVQFTIHYTTFRSDLSSLKYAGNISRQNRVPSFSLSQHPTSSHFRPAECTVYRVPCTVYRVPCTVYLFVSITHSSK